MFVSCLLFSFVCDTILRTNIEIKKEKRLKRKEWIIAIVSAVIGAVISLIAAGFSFTLINPEEKIRIMQQELKRKISNTRKENIYKFRI